jgi:hypothetical protein
LIDKYHRILLGNITTRFTDQDQFNPDPGTNSCRIPDPDPEFFSGQKAKVFLIAFHFFIDLYEGILSSMRSL